MLRHNLLLSFRSFIRNKSSFLINLAGLSTGLICVMLIWLWVSDELSIDKFHPNGKRLYQIMSNIGSPQSIWTIELTPVPLASALLDEMPEVESAVATNDFSTWTMREGILVSEPTHVQARGWHAGRDFFKVFAYDLFQGNRSEVLSDKSKIVISEALSKKLFHTTENVIGKTVEWKHPMFNGIFQVSGIFRDLPERSTAQFDFLISMDILLDHDRWAKEWTGNYARTFVVLKPGADANRFNEKIAQLLGSKNDQLKKFGLFAQLYSTKYLFGRYENGKIAGGRIAYVRLFSMIAIFILLIACINFMNLATAKASLHVKEIGVKKSIGVSRRVLVGRFLSESFLMTLLSVIVSIPVVALMLPLFNDLTGKSLTIEFAPLHVAVLGAIMVITALLAGSYPAFYLSKLSPINVVKGKLGNFAGPLLVRKGLVVFQFVISILFIIGVAAINEQIKFTQSKNLGYNRSNILSFQWKGELFNMWNGLQEGKSNQHFETFMEGLKDVPGVASATNMSGSILNEIYGQSGITWSGDESDESYIFQSPIVGFDFIETLAIPLKEGRSFSKEHHDDYSKIIINETAAHFIGLKDPVGKVLKMNGGSEIIGVVKDFHYGSLHNPIEPLIFRLDPTGRHVMIKIKPGEEKLAVAGIEKRYRQFLPDYTFEFRFMDDDYQALYTSEGIVEVLARYFSLIAILISCLGLFGLATFTAERRMKEISIRKVLGSGSGEIIRLLAGEFTRPVLLAIAIAVPVSFFMIESWLNQYAERIDLQWWVFPATGLGILLITWITVALQTIRAASANPVTYLKAD